MLFQAYRWLKAAAHKFNYIPELGGISLYEGALVDLKNPPESMFLFSCLGTQGFSPVGNHWRNFQNWFKKKIRDPSFKPYVDGAATLTGIWAE